MVIFTVKYRKYLIVGVIKSMNSALEYKGNLPIMLQVGVALLHVLLALHLRVVVPDTVYPVSQVNRARDK